jgi:putative membrane protein
MKLTNADHSKLNDAIARAEGKTSAELVLVVKGRYGDVHAVGAAAGALTGLAFVLFSEWEFDVIHVIPMALGSAAIGWLVSSLLVPRFLFKRRAAAQVEEAAHAQFSRLGVHRTADRVGILIYISHAETTGRILYDSGVAREIPEDVRDAWRARLPALNDADALVALLDEMGERLGHALPRGEDDVNELQDHVAA